VTVLGIDLGTTNSVVAVVQEGKLRILNDSDGHALIPSVVSFHPDGDIVVGSLAQQRRLVDAQNTVYSVKRLIGRPYDCDERQRASERFAFPLVEGPKGGIRVQVRDQQYALTEISAFVLGHLRAVAEEALGASAAHAVVTVPANFNELQRSATKMAGKVAGVEVLRILNEPTAAALAYGLHQEGRERVAVYDFGGGTFDVTILELAGDVYQVVATAGDSFLGGDDFDLHIADQLAEAFRHQHGVDPREHRQAFERVRGASEWAKCMLTSKDRVQLRIEELVYDDTGTGLNMDFELSRSDFEHGIRPLVERSFDICEKAMAIAGVRPTNIDNVVLVGGSTRVPLVRAMVKDYFGREPLTTIDPDLVVAQGAAIHAAQLAGLAAPGGPRNERAAAARRALADKQRERAARETGAQGPAFAPKARYVPKGPDRVRPRVAREQDEQQALRHSYPPAPVPELPPPSQPPSGSPVGSPSGIPLDLDDASVVAPPPPPIPPPVPGGKVSPPNPEASTADFGTIDLGEPEGDEPITLSGGEPHGDIELEAAPPAIDLPEGPPPLLLDVTPHSLGVETVGGYCEFLIDRNAQIPVEQTQPFATGSASQDTVRVRVCQGESRRMDDNEVLGELELTGLSGPVASQVLVTFTLDADGSLQVEAKDPSTGRAEDIRIRLLGGADDTDLEAMQERHQAALGE
jgi:molecular chaperone DnaK